MKFDRQLMDQVGDIKIDQLGSWSGSREVFGARVRQAGTAKHKQVPAGSGVCLEWPARGCGTNWRCRHMSEQA